MTLPQRSKRVLIIGEPSAAVDSLIVAMEAHDPLATIVRVTDAFAACIECGRQALDLVLVDVDGVGAQADRLISAVREGAVDARLIAISDKPTADCALLDAGCDLVLRGPSSGWGEEGSVDALLDGNGVTAPGASTELPPPGVLALERALVRAHRRERFLATHDGTTGLCNRAAFHGRLERELADCRRDGGLTALLRLDVDRFKAFNETHGPSRGDALLRHVGERLGSHARRSDLVARLGDDEFVLLLRDLRHVEDAASISESVLQMLCEPYHLEDCAIEVSTSIGIALFPDDCDDAQTLLGRADVALQQAKTSGGNDYRFYTRELEDRSRERRTLERSLRKALAADEFVVHYQPLIDLRTEVIFGVEALVRWNHPERGLISPAEFIPQAEELGLVGAISEWVLERATSQHRAWRESGIDGVRLAVNISVDQLVQRDLPLRISRTLEAAGMVPELLELEITERGILRDQRRCIRTLDGLKSLGVRISLDDFGTGQASLSYLRSFPADTVKLDRSYVSQIGENESDTAIAAAILALAESLHLDSIAEGVETTEQLRFLANRRCHRVQGFLFSGALPEPAIRAHLRQGAACLIGGARENSIAGNPV